LVRSRDELGGALTTLRLRAGLTIRDLALRAGLPSATVGGYVTGKHLPAPGQVDQFRAVLSACGVTDDGELARWDDALMRVRTFTDRRAGRRSGEADPPYRGLEPFQPSDAELFFGREQFVGLVIARLTDLWHAPAGEDRSVNGHAREPRNRRPRLLFVIGASGSGKSSLLRAGVYPAVLEGAIGPVGPVGPVGAVGAVGAVGSVGAVAAETVHNGSRPADGSASGHNGARPADAAWRAAIMVPGNDPRAALASVRHHISGAPALLIIDQFEELYTLTVDEAERAGFIGDLAALDANILIVAGMRADFFPAAARDTMLVPALQDWQMVVPPMSEDELRSAIVGPAQARGVPVDDALVEAVLGEVFQDRGPGTTTRQNALPLLSHALLSAWEQRRRGRLALADYRGAGGLAGAVQQSAEEAFTRLSDVEQEYARRLFLRLVTVDEDLVVTRRRIGRAELDELDAAGGHDASHPDTAPTEPGSGNEPDAGPVARVIEQFVSRRLVTVDADTVEVSHDALLAAWPRLAEWIAADHAGLRIHRRLTGAANAWQAADFDDQLLMRGTQLAAVEEWAHDPDHLADLNRLERDCLQSSVSVRLAEQRAARRRTNVLQGLVAALAALLFVAAGSAVYALHATNVADGQRAAANAERDMALSREVAIESTRAAATDQALAEQLALAAYRISPTVDARSALLDSTAGGVVNRIVGSSGPTTLRLNPAGTVLARSDAGNGDVDLLRYQSDRPGARIGVIPADAATDQVFALAFSPDGRTLAIGGQGGIVRLFDVADPARPRLDAVAPGGFQAAVEALAFSPNGSMLVAGGGQPALRAWDVTNPQAPTALQPPGGVGPTDVVQTVAFSPDGSLLAAGGSIKSPPTAVLSSGLLLLWSTASLRARPNALVLGESTIDFAVFGPDGRTIVTGDKTGVTNAVDVTAPTAPKVAAKLDTDLTSWANAAAYSPDGRLLAVGGSDGKLDTFDTTTWARLATITNSSPVTAVQYATDGTTLLTASADGTVRSWPARGRAIAGVGGTVFSVGYDSAGTRLALSWNGDTGGVSLWSPPPSPTKLATLALPAAFHASDGTVAISSDGRLIATGSKYGQMLLATIGADDTFGTPVSLPTGTKDTIESIAISPDGHTVAAGSDDGYVHLWDVRDPANPVTLPSLNAGNQAISIAFSENGRFLAAASVDRKVHWWRVSDPARAQALPTLSGFANYAWSVAFSPNSTLLAAGGADDTVRLWNIADPSRPRPVGGPVNGPSHYVFGLAFSPDGGTLAAAGGDGSVWTWQVGRAGSLRLSTMLHGADPGGGTYAVAFSPDGKLLTAGGTAAKVVSWDTDSDVVAAAVCRTAGDRLTRAEWAQYVPGAPYRTLCP
jgi:WD40 repeat protein/transcriptional regulator with XRE-family HTH domain